ncbi:MAG: RNA polymerase sigma factor [Treponemataceae bacterium]|nr:RNA polymerase sigma factor [Treponemataceae bacterium]
MFSDNKESQPAVLKPLNAADPADFKTIYAETMQMLYKISYRIVNDEEAAEDLAHDSLIKANEKRLTFPTINDAKYWLIRVVKNASLNYVKRKNRERKAYQKALYEDRRTVQSGETELLAAESIQRTKEALDKLPPKLREVIVLKEYSDLNYKEIGKVVGITEGNVKVRIFRARKLLEELLGGDDVFLPNG